MSSAALPLIKVCGLTTLGDALATVAAGADWIGLNFHPASPRRIDPAAAAAIVAALPATAEAVGLFVDRPPEEVAAVAARVGLRIVQLHGAGAAGGPARPPASARRPRVPARR